MGSASESHAFGAIAFFIQYLKMGHLFEPWVDECPLAVDAEIKLIISAD